MDLIRTYTEYQHVLSKDIYSDLEQVVGDTYVFKNWNQEAPITIIFDYRRVTLLHPILTRCPCNDSTDPIKRLFPCARFNYMQIIVDECSVDTKENFVWLHDEKLENPYTGTDKL